MLQGHVDIQRLLYSSLLGLSLCVCGAESRAQDPQVELGFRESPCFVAGAPGEELSFDVFISLTMLDEELERGPQGWSLSMTADGGEITDATVAGCTVPTALPILPEPIQGFALLNSKTLVVEIADRHDDDPPGGPFRKGAVMAVLMSQQTGRYLIPQGTVLVGKLEVTATVPQDGPCGEVTLRFEDDFVGSGQPVENVAVIQGENSAVAFTSLTIPVCQEPATVTCEIPFLQEGVPEVVALTRDRPSRSFRFQGTRDESAIVQALALDPPRTPRSNIALYANFGDDASPLNFVRAAAGGGPDQRLVVPIDRDGELFLSVRAIGIEDVVKVLLRADMAPLALEDMTTRSASEDNDLVRTSVLGDGFDGDTVFSLVPSGGGTPIPTAEPALIVSAQEAELVFDFSRVELGGVKQVFDLVAAQGEITAALPDAFTLLPETLGEILTVQVLGHRFYRVNRWTQFSVLVANEGDTAMPAPVLRISVPDTALRLGGEAIAHEDELFLLGGDTGALPEVLPPGAAHEIAFFLRNNSCPECTTPECPECMFTIQCDAFFPSEGDLIIWSLLPPLEGLTREEWNGVWPGLSRIFGSTYSALVEGYGRLASRRKRQGDPTVSLFRLFHFAYQLATDRPTSAITGTLKDADSGAALAGVQVVAMEGGAVKAAAITDPLGKFAIRCLEDGPEHVYDIAAVDHDIVGSPQETISVGEDLLGRRYLARPNANGLVAANPNCDDAEMDLPPEALPLPPELFSQIASLDVTVIGAFDPNEKEGSPDGGDAQASKIRVDDTLNYQIHFENQCTATAAVQTAVLEDIFEEDLDINTLKLTSLQIGGDVDGQNSPLKLVPLGDLDCMFGCTETVPAVPVDKSDPERDTSLDFVDVEIKFEVEPQADGTTKLTCTITGLDDEGNPLSESTKPEDALRGWLAVNDLDSDTEDDVECPVDPHDMDGSSTAGTHRGEAVLALSIKPKPGLEEGREITNEAKIIFDERAPIETDPVTHEISFFLPPEVAKSPVPADDAADVGREEAEGVKVRMSWQAERADQYDLFLWEGFGPRPSDDPTEKDLASPGYNAVGLKHDTGYSWQIEAVNEFDRTPGPVWQFDTKLRPPSAPGEPVGPKPADGEGNVARTPLLSWSGAGDAVTFDILLWPRGAGRPSEPEVAGITTFSYRVDRDLEADAQYSWQVLARNAGGPTFGPEWTFTTVPAVQFDRGDSNGDGATNITDAIVILGFLFLGQAAPPCEKAIDVDDDGQANITDAVSLLSFLFRGGKAPGDPFGACGTDPSGDNLSCFRFPPCSN